jgi:hypothetical protein
MTDLNMDVTDEQINNISTPELVYIMSTIKQIQKRMKDPDISKLEYIRVYDVLGREFDPFFNRYTGIFVKVIRGESLQTIAAVIYFKDQVIKGLTTEEKVADMLAKKFYTKEMKEQSDANLKIMKEKEIQSMKEQI